MRNLLIAFLLIIFSVQGAVVAIGEDVFASLKGHQRRTLVLDHGAATLPDNPAACVQRGDSGDNAAHAADADESTVSAAIEELSDYLPPDFSLPPPLHVAPLSQQPHLTFSSIDLPTIEPPPRA